MASYAQRRVPEYANLHLRPGKYTSPYLAFTSVEEYTNYLNKAKSYYATLQKPTAAQVKLVEKYDTGKYITGLSSSDGNPIPFMTFDNQFLVSGASYQPDTLTNLTRSQIAMGLSDPTSP